MVYPLCYSCLKSWKSWKELDELVGRIKTPKPILLSSIVKTLITNTEINNILIRLGHGVSCSLLMESQTEKAYQIYKQQLVINCIIPTNCQNEAFTISAADNSDRDEEKQSGRSFSLRHPTFKVATKLSAIRSFSIRKLLNVLM